jgi:hypothetical protein
MIYQVFFDQNSADFIELQHRFITPCGVYKSREMDRIAGCIYDDEITPNLTSHNTLCEWRVLYYVWKHYPRNWVGFTSWRHNEKHFSPQLMAIDEKWLMSSLKKSPITGLAVRPLRSLLLNGIPKKAKATLKTQFLQWKFVESLAGAQLNDSRSIPLGKYHDSPYWDFVMQEFSRLYGIHLERELDWVSLGRLDRLHTWCNAFVSRWGYFDGYMAMFTPIVFGLLDRFGSHPTDLELAYICERLIILYNYIQYSENKSGFD